jgi:heterodisulfide reductase subunit C
MQHESANAHEKPPNEQFSIEDDVLKVESERLAKPCYQCGICTGGCPVAKRNPEFNPRKIVHRFLVKRADRKQDQSIWLCLLCHSCVERCPQEVKPSHVIVALRNKAAQEGDIKQYIADELDQICLSGWSIPVMPAITKRREALGLPAVNSADVEEVHTIIESTGLSRLLKDSKERRSQQ